MKTKSNQRLLARIVAFSIALSFFSCTKRQPEEVDYAPNSPFNPYPPDSATNIDHTTLDVTLRWTATDPNSGDIMTYDLYFDTLNPPSTQIASGLFSASYFIDSLSYNTTYYWKLYITDDKGVITCGPVWQFTTLPHANSAPSIPVYFRPADNSSLQYPTINFGVNCTDPEGDSDTLYYDLYLGVTPQPPITLFQNDPASFWELTGLNYTTTYYWKVAARDNHYAYTSGPVYSFATRDCPWFYKRDLPSPRYGFGTAVVNNKIYVIGGTDGNNLLPEVLEYDPIEDIWVRKTDMPTPRRNLAVTVWDNKIYTLGGCDGLFVLKNNNEVYDPLLNSWNALSPLPESFSWATAHPVKNKIILLEAKLTDFGILTGLFEYDIGTDSWQIRSTLPHSNYGYCSAVYNDLIYVMGGTNETGRLPFVDVYHPGTNSWTTASDMIGPANASAATVANGFIYVIGGYDGTYSKRVRKYDPASNTWAIRSDLQTGRSLLGAAFAEGYIYAIGGVAPIPLSTMEEYRLDLDPKR